MSIGTTPPTGMTIDMGTSNPVAQKSFLIAMKKLLMGKERD